MKKSIIVILITVLIISSMWIADSSSEKEAISNVTVTRPVKKNIYDYVTADGRIKEGTKRDIYLRKPAKIEKVYVSEGQSVKKGSPLFEISSIEEEFLSENNIDEKKVFAVFEQYGFETPSIESFSFVSENDSIVTSPIDGIVTKITAKPGETASGIFKLASVSDFSDLYIDTLIPQAYSSKVKPGAEAKITSEAFGDTAFSGKIENIAPVAKYIPSITGDGKTYLSAVIRTNSSNHLFKPELSVKAKISVNAVNNALTVPYECVLQDENGEEFIFLAENGRIKKQIIETGYELESEIEVKKGIGENSLVVFAPDESLSEEQPVNILNYMEKE